MTRSQAAMEQMETQVSAFYLWEVAGKPASIQLSLDMVDRLEKEVLESFKAVTKRGSEVGGLLLGRVSPGGRRSVLIESYELVTCDYNRGPLYLLAEADRTRLENAVQRYGTAADKRTSVVGWFRSNTRKELALDEDDQAVIAAYFSNPDNVFLLIKPFSMKPCAAGFFVWEDGKVRGEATEVQFPFKRSELLKGAFAKSIISGGAQAAAEARPAAPAPVDGSSAAASIPKREERVAAPPAAFRREAGGPAPLTPSRPAEAPATPPPVPKPETRAAAPLTIVPKREEPTPPPPPVAPKPEARAAAPLTLVPKREEPAPPPPTVAPKPEPQAAAPPPPPAAPKLEVRVAAPAPVGPKREEPAPPPPPAAPKLEVRVAAPPLVAPKREEPAPPPPAAAKPQTRPPIQPVVLKREAPAPAPPIAAKREEPVPSSPAPPKLEARAAAQPAVTKPEMKPGVQSAAPKLEQSAPSPAPAPAKPEARAPVQPVAAKREEPAPAPPVAAKVEPRPAVQPVAKREPPKPTPSVAAKREEAAPLAVQEPALIPATSPSLFHRYRVVGAVAFLVLVVAVGLWLYLRPTGARAPAVTPGGPDAGSLLLRAERNAGQLLLSWNREAALVKTASRAVLSITDGDHKEDVELDLGQLRNGSIVYSPITNDVSFRLEVTDTKQGKSLNESIRVLAGRPSPTPPAGQTAPPKTTPAAEARPRSEPMPAATAPVKADDDGSGPPATPTETAPTQAPRSMAPIPVAARGAESLAARISQTPNLPLPPPVESQTSPAPIRAAETPAAPVVAPPPPVVKEAPKPVPQQPAAQPPVTTTPPPAAQAPVAQPPAAQPLKVGGNVQEAKLVRRTTPVYPPLARQARVTGVVRVEATVGRDGKITQAAAVSGPPLLRQAAADAVRQWLYQPSLLNGQPVEVVTQVDVTFSLNR